jgi:DNA-binding CsgD family transcriptional regulator
MTIASTTTTAQRDQTSQPCLRDIRVPDTHEHARQAEGELGPGVNPPRPMARSSCSPEARETLRTIALPISLGSSMKQVAAELGISPKSVSELMDELRDELTA